MELLPVIKAGRQLTQNIHNEASLKVNVYKQDEGTEEDLIPLEAVSLATILHATSAQLQILSKGSASGLNGTNNFIRDKLQKDLEETEISLRTRSSFAPLFYSAREEADQMQEAQLLDAVAVRNKEAVTSLRAKLQGNQRTKHRELHKKQETIASLKDQIQELANKRDAALSYVDRLLSSQREQSLLRSDQAEQLLRTQLDTLKDTMSNELSVHESLDTFLNLEIQALQKEIEKWTIFHGEEMDHREEKLKAMRIKITEERGKVRSFKELFEEHQREINEYLEFKEQNRLEAEHAQFMYDSATKIQAWWRGTMVRCGLGPYKKRKKLAKDKKKKK